MPCEKCNVKFGIITRKKSCYECHRLFCRNCLLKRQERFLCPCCTIFTTRPLSRVDLAQLKVKDLIFYLQSKHISTSGCFEKDDLINLVIAHVNSGDSSPHTPGSFSAASSNTESASGGSSRYGSFYRNGTKNCTNTFDQIKNTCQNLFSSFSDKFNGDVPEGGRTSAGFPAPEEQRHIFTQPRFGSNNVYSSMQDRESTNGAATFHPAAAGSDGSDNQRMPTGQNCCASSNVQEAHDSSASSGMTSGADSSAASSSFSSPSRMAASPVPLTEGEPLPEGHTQPTLDDRIETILALEAGGAGCECCSDEEDEEGLASVPIGDNIPHVERSDDEEITSQRSKLLPRSLSHSNLFPSDTAGPSVETTLTTPKVASRSHTPSSSFDDLLVDAEGSSSNADHAIAQETIAGMTETDALMTTAASYDDTEQWQIINASDTNVAGGSLDAAITHDHPVTDMTNEASTVTTNEAEETSDSMTNSVEINPKPPPALSSAVGTATTMIGRRRSDSYLFAQSQDSLRPRFFGTGQTVEGQPSSFHRSEVLPTSSHHAASHSTANMCFRCGKRRSGIRRQLKKFRKQLEKATGSEADKRRQLEAFLCYLERRSKGSFELSDSESFTEEASVSLVDEQTGDGVAAALDPLIANAGNQQSQSYPRPSDEMTICTNLYSSGNQELINMKQIKLSDIKESADLDVLSVKQLKAILMVNRVDFKGCCEKAELRERVLRLWRDYKSIPSIEKLPSDDLCKICMDAPIECVILECGHMTTCTACGKVLSECPICRQYIVRVVRFFRA